MRESFGFKVGSLVFKIKILNSYHSSYSTKAKILRHGKNHGILLTEIQLILTIFVFARKFATRKINQKNKLWE